MEPIDLCPVRKSTGEVVYQQLEAAAKKTSVPREILSDHGTDLWAGFLQFAGIKARFATSAKLQVDFPWWSEQLRAGAKWLS